uniref:Uncharacterized protein n=1 Tax=Ascaris lumbricoides TaxID=6252 RepID=A0A0M3IKG1_ASCLU
MRSHKVSFTTVFSPPQLPSTTSTATGQHLKDGAQISL